MATLTREGEEILVTAVLALDAGKTIVEDATIKIAVDHLFHISTEESVLGGKALVRDLLKFLKAILNALVRLGILRFPILPRAERGDRADPVYRIEKAIEALLLGISELKELLLSEHCRVIDIGIVSNLFL
jgi:hypothetical protein